MPEHRNLTNAADIHEAKQIASAATTDAGKVITPSSLTAGVGELRRLKIEDLDPAGRTPWTGWGLYSDSVYTASNKLLITGGAPRTKVTIDGLGSRTAKQLPVGAGELWDTTLNTITPVSENDVYQIRLTVKGALRSTAGGAVKWMDIELDLGGGIGVIASKTDYFPKDTATHLYMFSFPAHAGSTFLAYGGTFYVRTEENTDLWDFDLFICRVHGGS